MFAFGYRDLCNACASGKIACYYGAMAIAGIVNGNYLPEVTAKNWHGAGNGRNLPVVPLLLARNIEILGSEMEKTD